MRSGAAGEPSFQTRTFRTRTLGFTVACAFIRNLIRQVSAACGFIHYSFWSMFQYILHVNPQIEYIIVQPRSIYFRVWKNIHRDVLSLKWRECQPMVGEKGVEMKSITFNRLEYLLVANSRNLQSCRLFTIDFKCPRTLQKAWKW